jgi:hypothetical protein
VRTLKENQTKDSSLTPEPMVAARLGLTRVVCAALRRDHLKPQVDYVIEGGRVMITEAGYVALRVLLGCPESPDEEKARVSHCVGWDGDQCPGGTSSIRMFTFWWGGRLVTAGDGSPNSPSTPTRIATAVRLARKASPLAWRKRQSHRPKGIDMGRTEAIRPLHEVRPRIDESDSNGR